MLSVLKQTEEKSNGRFLCSFFFRCLYSKVKFLRFFSVLLILFFSVGAGLDGHSQGWSPGSSLLDGDVPRDRNPFEDEEDENEANEGKRGGVGGKGGVSGGKVSGKSSFKFSSPLKTLGKLGKNLRASGRGKDSTPSPSPSPGEKKKRGRRSSEGSLLR